jgi:NADH-ubiquinone oxidoreductase chain 3
MKTLSFFFIFVPIVAGLLLLVNILFAVHKPDSEKISPFECGFTGFSGQTRTPFSISFYLVGLLFLIFDLEIALLYPYIVSSSNNSNYGLWFVIFFLLILTVGFIYEFSKGALKITRQDVNESNYD